MHARRSCFVSQIFLVVLGCFLILGSPGCSGARTVEIDTRPAEARGAAIFVDGEKRGETPAKVQITIVPPRRVLIQVVKPNYKPAFQYWSAAEVPDKKVFDLEDE